LLFEILFGIERLKIPPEPDKQFEKVLTLAAFAAEFE
jgi:hypothetical protein